MEGRIRFNSVQDLAKIVQRAAGVLFLILINLKNLPRPERGLFNKNNNFQGGRMPLKNLTKYTKNL